MSAPKAETAALLEKLKLDPWDVFGWLRFLEKWKEDWEAPGGLTFDDFKKRLVLSIVPPGWIKAGYGGAGPTGRDDIGRGHQAFIELFATGLFDGAAIPTATMFRYFDQMMGAISQRDKHFFADFSQCVEAMHECKDAKRPLLGPHRKFEFMVLASMLEEPEPAYRVVTLQKRIEKLFGGAECPDYKEVERVMRRFSVARP